MSGIAEILAQYELDLTVSGCDLAERDHGAPGRPRRPRRLVGHSPDHLDGVDLVVISSAVAESDNPEVRRRAPRGITVVRRAEMLAELMRLRTASRSPARTARPPPPRWSAPC
jgi:UDP-N-acetylmuramate--alanine ligase